MDIPKLTKTNTELFLTRVYIKGGVFYMDKALNFYNDKSYPIKFEKCKIYPLKFKMNSNIMETHCTLMKEIYLQSLKKLFGKFDGKKIGEEFSLEDALNVIMNENYESYEKVDNREEQVDNKEEQVDNNEEQVDNKAEQVDNKEEQVDNKEEQVEKVKEKKPRKKSGYNFYCLENKIDIMKKLEEFKGNDPDKKLRWLSVAGTMWKELTSEERKVYEDKVE